MKDGMMNVKDKKCIYDGCQTKASYNNEGSPPIFCSIHRKKDMVELKNKKCKFNGCKTRPNYNFEGYSPNYCVLHKTDGMIDVSNKKCINDGCKHQASFNYIGEKALYCSIHKKENMLDVKNKKCVHVDCNTIPNYNYIGEKALYCSIHKKENMVDVTHKKCKSEWCLTQVSEKYEGYCLFCFIHLFPDKKVSRNYKTKEREVTEYVKSKFETLTWLCDKKISDGCSRRRPDLLLDLGEQIIIVEIDENQHNSYDCSCENKRMMELSKDLGHRPIIFIRFNPDEYLDENNTIISCWSKNKDGICIIKQNKKKEWEERLKQLEENVNYWLINRTDKMIEVIHLFYDL